MNKKILMLAATLIAGAGPVASQVQTPELRAEAGRQVARPGTPNFGSTSGGGQVTRPDLLSNVPQSQGGTAPNTTVLAANLPRGLVPAPGRDPAPQLSTDGGSQLQQPGQMTTR